MGRRGTHGAPPPYSGVDQTTTTQSDDAKAEKPPNFIDLETKDKSICQCQCPKHKSPKPLWNLHRIFSKNENRILESGPPKPVNPTQTAKPTNTTRSADPPKPAKPANSTTKPKPKPEPKLEPKPEPTPQVDIIEPYFVKCGIQSLHLESKYHATKKQKDSPWAAHIGWTWKEKGDGLTVMPSWRDIVGRGDLYDEATVTVDPLHIDRRTWRRNIRIQYIRLPEYPYQLTPRIFLKKDARPAHEDRPESAEFYLSIYSRDLEWLKGLSRAQMSDLISVSTGVLTIGYRHASKNPLEFPHVFYIKRFCKERLDINPWYLSAYGRLPSDLTNWTIEMGLEKTDIDAPELRHIAEETIERYIRRPGERISD